MPRAAGVGVSFVHHEVAYRWRLQDRRTQANTGPVHTLRRARRTQGGLQPRQRVVWQFQQGADIAQTALLSEQSGDIQDPLGDDNASARSIPRVVTNQLHVSGKVGQIYSKGNGESSVLSSS